jgi:TusA-related sulfurtransferase
MRNQNKSHFRSNKKILKNTILGQLKIKYYKMSQNLSENIANNLKADVFLDLKGTPCPLNYVKTKLKMEEMEVGQIIEVILDDGEPIRNVPLSLKQDGQEVLLQEKIDSNHWRVLIRKVK